MKKIILTGLIIVLATGLAVGLLSTETPAHAQTNEGMKGSGHFEIGNGTVP